MYPTGTHEKWHAGKKITNIKFNCQLLLNAEVFAYSKNSFDYIV